MRRICLALMLCFFPVFVWAQEGRPLNDWDIIFAENEEQIEKITLKHGLKIDKLVLPSGIVVEKIYADTGIKYRTRDPNGAVACLYFRYLHMQRTIERCPSDMESERGQAFMKRLERLSEFVKENAVPPLKEDIFKQHFLNAYGPNKPASARSSSNCGLIDGRTYDGITGSDADARFSEILRVPRPPVMGDCL